MSPVDQATAFSAESGRPGWSALLALPRSERPAVRFHLIGIGGSGLSAIARLLLERGFRVSGSDARPSPALEELAASGAVVAVGHRAEHVAGASVVLVSSAVPATNPEVLAAQQAGIPVVKRDQFLAPLMAGHLNLCVAGTHGKTTTSALLATLLDAAGAEPSFLVGSEILNLGTAARAGRPAGPFVLEADEYDRTFLGLEPAIAVVTNVDWDHVDCYPNPASYEQAFAQFVARVPAGGAVVYCGDDPGARRLREIADFGAVSWISYGLDPSNAWQAQRLSGNNRGGTDFDVMANGALLGRASLTVPGEHNVRNALAALAAANAAGDVFTAAHKNLKILQNFTGTARRLEHKGTCCDIIVLDDYAHHPTEVRATLSAARQRFPRQAIWVLFQPHTFSRTQAMLSDFCESLKNADHVLIADIYAAREHDTMGVSSQNLADKLSSHPDARYVGSLSSAVALLLAELQPGDVLLTLGAGDGYTVGEKVLAELRRREGTGRAAPLTDRIAELASAIHSQVGLTVLREEPLAHHTTLKVGGPADLFVAVTTTEQLVAVVSLARAWQVPVWLLGGGSNVVVSDAGVRGLVIANGCRAVRQHEGHVVWAESGANLAGLARQSLRWGLSGLEWGVSVPGTVGGAVVGNAGAHGGCVADNLLRITLLMPDGALTEWPAARLQFGYRSSALKEMVRRGQPAPLVLSAAFQLAPGDTAEMEVRAASFLAHRRATQPVEPSAGSTFQNPPGDYAGRILDTLGFKGRRRGDAAFSTVHANFIVNLGHATAADVVGLIDEARQAVWQAMGIELMPEILFAGDWPEPPYGSVTGPISEPRAP